ncbi:efflux RND transporter periplasmic adaptor subunit [Symbioplanes lichenis]|uniref:efflux RND transporter periplasmic adaptor subunit n=1 Tax=Symbioplanes lichenis TaxID=1629072 RepID=UPI002738EDF1|nr:HlyD family efflux transporter periplasmic adaptor subunit [Actinoplanes lichenis]
MVSTPRRAAVALAACLLLPPLTAASCTDEPSGITLGQATRGTVTEIVEASGAVTARAAGTVTSPAEGTLAALRVEPGGRVRKGQVVAVIASPATEQRFEAAAEALDATSTGGGTVAAGSDFEAVRVRTDAAAEQAFATAREHAAEVTDPAVAKALTAQLDAARKQYLAASTAAAETVRALQRGVAGVGEAVAALSTAQRVQARQAYDLAEAAVDALTLRAPVAGVVQLGGSGTMTGPALTDLLPTAAAGNSGPLPGVSEALPVGAPVGVGTPILTVVDISAPGVTAEVDETDILLVEPGGKGTVELDAAPGVTWDATVRSVDLLPTTSARGGVSYRVHP